MMPLAVEVQEGQIALHGAANGGDISTYLDTFRQHATIDGQFATCILPPYPERLYKFDRRVRWQIWFPEHHRTIRPSNTVTDDEIGYYVTDFEVLP